MLQPLSSTSRAMMIGLSSEELSPIELSVLDRWTIRPRLMGVPGVANVAIWGQRQRQLQVQADPERLPAARLLAQVGERYAAQAARAGAAVEVEADDRLEVVADRLHAEQALGNLPASRPSSSTAPSTASPAPTLPAGSRRPPRLAIVAVIARAHGGTAHAANRPQGADVWVEPPHRG